MAMIPAKNPTALIGYYLGVFSLIPFFGVLLGLPALVCGIIGFVHANKHPSAQGKGHAITAIILGILGPAVGTGGLFVVLRMM